MGQDGLSHIKGGKTRKDGSEEKDAEEKDVESNLQASRSCPVRIIHVIKRDTGERLE